MLFLLNIAIICIFVNISFSFSLFTNKARKLKFAESNQAKAGLTKLWLATDACRSFASNSPDVSGYVLFPHFHGF